MVNPLAGEKVYLDASVLIYAIEAPKLFPLLCTFLLDALDAGEIIVATSWITLGEVLVKPLQAKDTDLEEIYREFMLPSPHLEIYPVNQAIIEQAAALRAVHNFKLPDAIHIATGMVAGCTRYLTGDAKWSQAGLQIIEASKL